MTLAEAVEKFQTEFESVSSRERQQESKDFDMVWSGGVRKWDETSAALYATKDAAVTEWLRTANSIVHTDANVLEWVLKPELLEFQITIADRQGRHRTVNNRFAVKSQFIVKDKNG